jgi:hypothetical protein
MQGNVRFPASIRPATKGRMLRLFTALPIPWDVAQTLKRRQTGLPGARWRPEEALHITLAFYGDVPEHQADDLAGELARIPVDPFEIELRGVGTRGDAHQAHTLWAGVEPNEKLTILAGRCKAAAERAGIRMEPRLYQTPFDAGLSEDPDQSGPYRCLGLEPQSAALSADPHRPLRPVFQHPDRSRQRI